MSSTDPNLGLNYGWTLGESGWDTGMDANLKRLGAVVGLSVKDRDLTTPPASPAMDLAKKMDSRYFCTVNPKEGVMSKRFSEQFKQEAVQLVSAERPIRQVASYLGIGYSTLDKWVRAHRERTGQLVALTQEQKRIRELERQVAHLQEVNDILKKATVYFANPANR